MFTLVFCFTSPVINIAVLTTLTPTTQGGTRPPTHLSHGIHGNIRSWVELYLGRNAMFVGPHAGTSPSRRIQSQNHSFTQGNVNVPDYPLAGSIAWLYADAVIHLVIAWYLDNIIPGEFGVKLPFWFVFSPSYWKHVLASLKSNAQTPVAELPSSAPSTSAAVEVSGLVKMFRKNALYDSPHDKLAVNGVSFSINEGQVFSFLGHNGAGKTTTINLLCGM
jgi:ABC-type glutathione transport system ATPase component